MPRPFRRIDLICTKAALLLLAGVSATPALAVSPFEGRYQGRGEGRLDLQVFELSDDTDAHFVIAQTAIPNQCTGELRGLARSGGPGTLILLQKGSMSEEVCTLTLRFSSDRTRVQMQPKDCGDFHGPACDFDGALKRR